MYLMLIRNLPAETAEILVFTIQLLFIIIYKDV